MSNPSNISASPNGEKIAQIGYVNQYINSAIQIHRGYIDRSLDWIEIASEEAGIADDLIIGAGSCVICNQFKYSSSPEAVGIVGLFLGADKLLPKLSKSWRIIKNRFPNEVVKIRLFTNDIPSKKDKAQININGLSTSDFLKSWAQFQSSSYFDWKKTKWEPLFKRFFEACSLSEIEFSEFWQSLELIIGSKAEPILGYCVDPRIENEIKMISTMLPVLIAKTNGKTKWTRSELLAAIGFKDNSLQRHQHVFPLVKNLIPNKKTEEELVNSVEQLHQGYIALIGEPGIGKSTILQRKLSEHKNFVVVRYLAFMPDEGHGHGRAEAEDFLRDLNTQLAAKDSRGNQRVFDTTISDLRETFTSHLSVANERYIQKGVKTLIVIDGLDHIPREEKPTRSFLNELFIPHAIPEGVLVIMGTQTINLPDLPPAIKDHVEKDNRRQVNVARLSDAEIFSLASLNNLTEEAEAICEKCDGHPLVAQYFITKLKNALPESRSAIIKGEMRFEGQLEAVYDSAWRSLPSGNSGKQIHKTMSLLSYAEGEIEAELLAKEVSEEAVESTYDSVGHLLKIVGNKWQIFHNSFRLYIKSKPVKKYGTIDKDFSSKQIYNRLSNLSEIASEDSSQKWLKYRYLFLAGEKEQGLLIATRAYFVEQFLKFRPVESIIRDIKSTYQLMDVSTPPSKIFEMMLAYDELDRRSRAFIYEGKILSFLYDCGQKEEAISLIPSIKDDESWFKILDRLVEEGKFDLAKNLFEKYARAIPVSKATQISRNEEFKYIQEWCSQACIFLTDDEIKSAIDDVCTSLKCQNFPVDAQEIVDFELSIKSTIALSKTANCRNICEIEETLRKWNISQTDWSLAYINTATNRFEGGHFEEFQTLADYIIANFDLAKIHYSWINSLIFQCIEVGRLELAIRFFEKTRTPNFQKIISDTNHYNIAQFFTPFFQKMLFNSWLGLDDIKVSKTGQNTIDVIVLHLKALAEILGNLRRGKSIDENFASTRLIEALTFVMSVDLRSERNIDSRLSNFNEVTELIVNVIIKIMGFLSNSTHIRVSDCYDKLVEVNRENIGRYRYSTRRLFVAGLCNLNGDKVSTNRRLKAIINDYEFSTTYEQVTELIETGYSFLEVGDTIEASTILNKIFSDSLGCDAAAKKDGQYQLWTYILREANLHDPLNAKNRILQMAKYLDGVNKSEGDDLAWRSIKLILLEAAKINSNLAIDIAKFVANRGLANWESIIDSILTGIIIKNSSLIFPAARCWCQICLPYYKEPYNGLMEFGTFVRSCMKFVEVENLNYLENLFLKKIGTYARHDSRVGLLEIIENEKNLRKNNDSVSTIYPIIEAASEYKKHQSNKYFGIASLSELESELNKTEIISESKSLDISYDYDLHPIALNLFSQTNWEEIKNFCSTNLSFVQKDRLAIPIAKCAILKGEKEFADTILNKVLNPVGAYNGWSFMPGNGLRDKFEAELILGNPNVKSTARLAFISHLASSRYGPFSDLWELEKIFDLTFEKIVPNEWQTMWEVLEANIISSRDYLRGEDVLENNSVEDDLKLISFLIIWANQLGAIDISKFMKLHLCEFSEETESNHLLDVLLNKLLDGNEEEKLTALNVIKSLPISHKLSHEIISKLTALVESEDAAILRYYQILRKRNGEDFAIKGNKLPSFYSLHLPESGITPKGRFIADKQTRGTIVSDKEAWCYGISHQIKFLSMLTDLSEELLKRRVTQFIELWGGVDKFGNNGSKQTQEKLSLIGLKLTYARPQMIIASRALRKVIGELYRANMVSEKDVDYLMFTLGIDYSEFKIKPPEKMMETIPEAILPENAWESDIDTWLSQFDELKAFPSNIEGFHVFGGYISYMRSYNRTDRIVDLAIVNSTKSLTKNDFNNLDDFFQAIPKNIDSIDQNEPTKNMKGEPNFGIATIFESHLSVFEYGSISIDPRIAQFLGWRLSAFDISTYYNENDELVAKTLSFRKGVRQPLGEDGLWIHGQIVLLSEAGKDEFESAIGKIKLIGLVWKEDTPIVSDGDPKSEKHCFELSN